MGGGRSKYVVEEAMKSIEPCSWLLTPTDCVKGPFKHEMFQLSEVVGKGKFGLVYTATHSTSGKYVAIKFISKKIICETKSIHRIQQEIDIVQDISHPFIVHCFGVYEMDRAFGLVFDYASGGELYTRMKKEEKFKEPVAKFYFCEIASALGYLHDKDILYRDLKPENILIDNDGHIKLCDFGFAVVACSTQHDGCGSAMYVAPEIAGGGSVEHGLPVDWWSLGCILFEMVTGDPPFGDVALISKFEIFNYIINKDVQLPMSTSGPLKELIKGLLTKDPRRRYAKQEVKNAGWLCDINWKLVSSKKYSPPWLPKNRMVYNSENYLDWPKESLENLKDPTEEESRYASNLVIPRDIRARSSSGNAVLVNRKSIKMIKHESSKEIRRDSSIDVKAGANRKSFKGDDILAHCSQIRDNTVSKVGAHRNSSTGPNLRKGSSVKHFGSNEEDETVAKAGGHRKSGANVRKSSMKRLEVESGDGVSKTALKKKSMSYKSSKE